MRFIISILLTIVLAFIGGLYFPWWIIAIAAFISGVLIALRAGLAFLSGFLALFLLYGGLALWINIENQGMLAARISQVFKLGSNATLMVLVTAVIGGLVAGFGSMTGSFLRPRKRN